MAASDCRPTRQQQQILLAALGSPAAAIAAWHSLEKTDVFAEEAARRLLPLIFENLRHAGISSQELSAARDVRRRTVVANEVLFRAVAPAVAALEAQGITTVLLKGASLALRYYRDPGLRPMTDIDLLVKADDAERAITLLASAGFRSRSALTARRRELIHAEDLADGGGHHIDLHWRLSPHATDVDEGLWSRLENVDFSGVSTHTLSPADDLLHTIVHGLHWSPTPPLRWVADACGILAGGEVDWDVFARSAKQARRVTAATEALAYLCDTFGAAIPDDVVAALAQNPDSTADRIEYELGTRRITYTVFGGLPIFAFHYLRDARKHRKFPHPFGLATYLRDYWDYESVPVVLRRIFRRAWLRFLASLTDRPLPPVD